VREQVVALPEPLLALEQLASPRLAGALAAQPQEQQEQEPPLEPVAF